MTQGLESFIVYNKRCGIQIIFKVQWTKSKESLPSCVQEAHKEIKCWNVAFTLNNILRLKSNSYVIAF